MGLSLAVHATFSTRLEVSADGVSATFSAGTAVAAGEDLASAVVVGVQTASGVSQVVVVGNAIHTVSGVGATFGAGDAVASGEDLATVTVSGVGATSSVGIAAATTQDSFGELSAVVHATFTTDATASLSVDGVSATFGAGAVGWSTQSPDAGLSAVVHATFDTLQVASNAEAAAAGVEAEFTADNLGASSSQMEDIDGAAITAAAEDVAGIGNARASLAGVAATSGAGQARPSHNAIVRPTGVVSTTGRGVPSWLGTPDVALIPEGVEATAAAEQIWVDVSSNPRLTGVSGFSGVGAISAFTISRPRPTGVGATSAVGSPTVSIGFGGDVDEPLVMLLTAIKVEPKLYSVLSVAPMLNATIYAEPRE